MLIVPSWAFLRPYRTHVRCSVCISNVCSADGQTKLFKSRRSTIVLQATFGSYIFLIAAGLIVLIVTENSSKAMITVTYFLYGAVFLSVAARFVFSVVRKTRKSIEECSFVSFVARFLDCRLWIC